MSFLSSPVFFTTVLGSVPWIDPPRACQIADVGPGCISAQFIWVSLLKRLTLSLPVLHGESGPGWVHGFLAGLQLGVPSKETNG